MLSQFCNIWNFLIDFETSHVLRSFPDFLITTYRGELQLFHSFSEICNRLRGKDTFTCAEKPLACPRDHTANKKSLAQP